MSFDFKLDDLLDFGENSGGARSSTGSNAVLREFAKESNGNPLSTTASKHDYGTSQISVTNMGALLMGTPMYKDADTSSFQQEHLLGNLFGGALVHNDNFEGEIGSGFNELIPLDVTKTAANINEGRIKTGNLFSEGLGGAPVVEDNPSASPAPTSPGGYKYPLPPPVHYGSPFNPARPGPTDGVVRPHNGVDIGRPTGTAVYASRAGKVSIPPTSSTAGKYVIIDHGDAETRYLHLNRISVNAGTDVAAGARIGDVGNTGRSTGPHLHFEIRTGANRTPVDPQLHLPRAG
jgi:murein DD-endopeptidase MepM/ murein hydrolase activator NlpD